MLREEGCSKFTGSRLQGSRRSREQRCGLRRAWGEGLAKAGHGARRGGEGGGGSEKEHDTKLCGSVA